MVNACWIIGNEQKVNFWMDRWVDDQWELYQEAKPDVQVLDLTIHVRDYVRSDGLWNVNLLRELIPNANGDD